VEERLREALLNEKTVLKEKYGVRTSMSMDVPRSMASPIKGQDGFGSPIIGGREYTAKPKSSPSSPTTGPSDDGLQILIPAVGGHGQQQTLRKDVVGADAPFRAGAGGPLTRDRPISLISETMDIPEKIPEVPEDSAV